MKKRTPPNIAPEKFYDPIMCPVRNIVSKISGKWSLLVLTHLKFGSHRFSELKNALPDISQRMLTQTLRNLEREGLVLRTVTPTTPPRVDYELTSLGTSLFQPLSALSTWALEKKTLIERARKKFDSR